jgi:hypothetical protein
MMNRGFSVNNGQLNNSKNVRTQGLDYLFHGRRNIRMIDVKIFVEERFDRWKLGTDFTNIQNKFNAGKGKAQRILKAGREKGIFFAPTRKNPQQYFPESRHFDVIEYINKTINVSIGTTGIGQFKHPLSYALEQGKASSLLETLILAKDVCRQIHNIQLEFVIDKGQLIDDDYYSTISVKEWSKNKGKALYELIEDRKVTYTFYRNAKIAIWISSSTKPFQFETEDDILELNSFFGQVKDRLESQILDPRGRLVPPISSWTLKQCDFNKDIPITDRAQIILPDIQLSTAIGVFRTYVKNLQGKAVNRVEEVLRINQPLKVLESIIFRDNGINEKLDLLNSKLDSFLNNSKL